MIHWNGVMRAGAGRAAFASNACGMVNAFAATVGFAWMLLALNS